MIFRHRGLRSSGRALASNGMAVIKRQENRLGGAPSIERGEPCEASSS
jgi:hypothetical protein